MSEANMSACACKGIRTCLICEQIRGAPRSKLHGSRLRSITLCYRCGKPFLTNQGLVPDDLISMTSCSPICKEESTLETCCMNNYLSGKVTSDHLTAFGGVWVVKNFLSEEEEKDIVSAIDHTQWAESQSGRRKQDYGPKVNFKRQKVKLGSFDGLPSFSECLIDRMHKTVPQLTNFRPVELCNLDYSPERGSAIDPHCDDSWLWGERLVTLNLLSHTLLTFTTTPTQESRITPPQSPPPTQVSQTPPPSHITTIEVNIPLPRRSLVIVSGPSRHSWYHSIKRENIVSRRIAVTLRELTPEFQQGGRSYDDVGRSLLETAANYNGHPTNFIL